jgi:hypothetical protein
MTASPPLAEALVAGLWCVVYAEAVGATVLCYDGPTSRRCPWGARVVRAGDGVRVVGDIGGLRSHQIGGAAAAESRVLKWVSQIDWS